jgi:hypothetical protein
MAMVARASITLTTTAAVVARLDDDDGEDATMWGGGGGERERAVQSYPSHFPPLPNGGGREGGPGQGIERRG